MAKVVSGTKEVIYLALTGWERLPAPKLGADAGKYLNVRRALRKPLKDFIDYRAEQGDLKNAQMEKVRKDIEPLQEASSAATGDEKVAADKAFTDAYQKAAKEINKFDELVNDAFKALSKEDAEVSFDNEEFSYLKKILTENAGAIFAQGEKKEMLNVEALDKVMTFLDSAK